MASHIVEIRRRGNTTNLPDTVYADSKQKISSVFERDGSGNPYTGLTEAQIRQFMPSLLGMSTQDVLFNKAVQDYFRNIAINVPTEGVKLEAGLDKDELPIKTSDYVKYLYIQGHPRVANNESEIRSKYNYQFYVFDGKKQQTIQFNQVEAKRKAYTEFIKLEDNDKKIDMMLRQFGQNPDKLDAQQKMIYLEDKVGAEPVQFVKYITDKNLETQAFILELLGGSILRKIGNAIYNGDDPIGDDMDEAVLYINNAKNSSVVTTLKARLQAFAKGK